MNHRSANSVLFSFLLLLIACKSTSDNPVIPSTLDSLNRGLVAYYPFNGNATDASGNGNDGIVSGATLTSDRFGHSNSAYFFDNCSSIRIPEMLSDSAPAFTITAWVKKAYIDGANHQILIKGSAKGEASLTNVGTTVGFGVNLTPPAGTDGSSGWYSANTPDTLEADVYYFIVGRYVKGERVEIMINGLLESMVRPPSWNMVVDSRTYSAIGTHTQQGFTGLYCWHGAIDDVRIYSRALTDDEVQLLYHEGGWTGGLAPAPNLDSGLVAYYPFNGNANDASGNGNNGTVNGATLTADRFGTNNAAYFFDNCSSIRIPELLSDSVQQFTIAAWVQKQVIDGGNHQVFIKGSAKGEASLTNVGSTVGFGVNLTPPNGSPGSTAWYSANTPDTLRANAYYFLVGRYVRGQRVDMMVNGVLGSRTTPPSWNMVVDARTYSALGIHTQSGFTSLYCWHGVIDDVRIYSRALSDKEVQLLYHQNGWVGN